MNAPFSIRSENGFEPGRLWSLWDMQRFYADRLSIIWAGLATHQSALSKTKLSEADLMTSAFQSAMNETMLHIKRELRIMGLLSASHQVERIEEQLKWIGKTYEGVPTRVKPELLAQMIGASNN